MSVGNMGLELCMSEKICASTNATSHGGRSSSSELKAFRQ